MRNLHEQRFGQLLTRITDVERDISRGDLVLDEHKAKTLYDSVRLLLLATAKHCGSNGNLAEFGIVSESVVLSDHNANPSENFTALKPDYLIDIPGVGKHNSKSGNKHQPPDLQDTTLPDLEFPRLF